MFACDLGRGLPDRDIRSTSRRSPFRHAPRPVNPPVAPTRSSMSPRRLTREKCPRLWRTLCARSWRRRLSCWSNSPMKCFGRTHRRLVRFELDSRRLIGSLCCLPRRVLPDVSALLAGDLWPCPASVFFVPVADVASQPCVLHVEISYSAVLIGDCLPFESVPTSEDLVAHVALVVFPLLVDL